MYKSKTMIAHIQGIVCSSVGSSQTNLGEATKNVSTYVLNALFLKCIAISPRVFKSVTNSLAILLHNQQ